MNENKINGISMIPFGLLAGYPAEKEDISAFMENYWMQNGFPQPVPDVIPDRLYIGNQFCHLLLPEERCLFELMEKVDNWCKERQTTVEIVVNDWAMVGILRKYPKRMTPLLGTLLMKQYCQRKPGTPTVISAARRAVDCVDYISFGKPESHTSNWLAAKTAIINKKQQKCQKS